MKLTSYLNIICLLFPFLLNSQSSGVGNDRLAESRCLSQEDRTEIKQKINENQKLLNLKVKPNPEKRIVDDLLFPLELAGTVPGFNDFYGVSFYVDHDNSSAIQDHNCLDKTYNGHDGTDFFTFPFPWYLYENDLVHVISAFEGTIVLKQDGNADTNCSPNGQWNAVFVQHEDGSIIWYGHLKSGSLTSKGIGETVEKGEYIGVVASSGYSTGPHLHLEYYDENENLIDPFQGDCNATTSNSLWEVLPAYSNPKINAVLTHHSQPNIECGLSNEISAFSNEFHPNENLYVGVYLTDYMAGSVAVTNIYRPDNSLYDSFNTFNTQNSYGWFWNSRTYLLLDADPKGTWTVESTLGANVVTHTFEYINMVTSTDEQENIDIAIHPNPTNDIIYLEGIEESANNQYCLYDCYGKVAKKGALKENRIRLDELPVGLYYLVVVKDEIGLPPMKIMKY